MEAGSTTTSHLNHGEDREPGNTSTRRLGHVPSTHCPREALTLRLAASSPVTAWCLQGLTVLGLLGQQPLQLLKQLSENKRHVSMKGGARPADGRSEVWL